MRRLLSLSCAVLLVGACTPGNPPAATETAAATTTAVATNKAGLPAITFDPCTQLPASVIAAQKLDKRPPRPERISDGKTESNICRYLSWAGYGVSVWASNYTIEMDKKVPGHWGFQEFDINGRRALSFYLSAEPEQNTCNIEVAATTGIYGVKVDSAHAGYGDYPDCLTTARAHLDAFLPYFPQ